MFEEERRRKCGVHTQISPPDIPVLDLTTCASSTPPHTCWYRQSSVEVHAMHASGWPTARAVRDVKTPLRWRQ